MTRAILFLVLPLAAVGVAGCTTGATRDCGGSSLIVYWAPDPASNAGFYVPGLPAAGFAARLGCAEAGVDSVDVVVGGSSVPCSGGFCRGGRWACDVLNGGIQVPLPPALGYSLQVNGYDPVGNLKYAYPALGATSVDVLDCSDTIVDAIPTGVPGPLGLDYAFAPAANCATGGAGTFMWFDLRDLSNVSVDAVTRSTVPSPYVFRCGDGTGGTANPIPILGGTSLAAGVYRLAAMEEVVDNGDGTSASVHGACAATDPASWPMAFVHAGPEDLLVDLPLLPAGTLTCFP
ncbi:MAG TPA: hypothetical protein VH880_06950 [Anaeromyxobacteraceae bacterium]|jgi:hypothetical protein